MQVNEKVGANFYTALVLIEELIRKVSEVDNTGLLVHDLLEAEGKLTRVEIVTAYNEKVELRLEEIFEKLFDVLHELINYGMDIPYVFDTLLDVRDIISNVKRELDKKKS